MVRPVIAMGCAGMIMSFDEPDRWVKKTTPTMRLAPRRRLTATRATARVRWVMSLGWAEWD